MDTQKMKVAEEIVQFCSTLKNLIAFGSEIENVVGLEDRAAQASRTLVNAEARHKGILAIVNVEEAAANAEARIADLKAAETKATTAKELAQTSLTAVKQELGTVTTDLAASKKQLAEIQATIARIRGAVA